MGSRARWSVECGSGGDEYRISWKRSCAHSMIDILSQRIMNFRATKEDVRGGATARGLLSKCSIRPSIGIRISLLSVVTKDR